MIIKFLLRGGKVVTSPYAFEEEQTEDNLPFYLRLKILELNNELIDYIRRYRRDNHIQPSKLKQDFFIKFVSDIEENPIRLSNYTDELKEQLYKQTRIDILKIQKDLKEHFIHLSIYKNIDKSPNPLALVELLLFGVIRVTPGLPLIDITREINDKVPSVHIHIRNNVKITELIRFIKKNYKKKIEPLMDKPLVKKRDNHKISERDLKIMYMAEHQHIPFKEIANQLSIPSYNADDVARVALQRLRNEANS
jgi:hypothetical protein